jgi:diaminopimelate epimerase
VSTPFYKMTGSGNDFVMLDGRTTTAQEWPPGRVQTICDRRHGVGADGLVILGPSSRDTVRMTYWNSDGSEGALCGNAALCGGRLAVALELVPSGEFSLLTDAGTVRVRASAGGEEAEINVPDFETPREVAGLELAPGERWMAFVTVGVPHLVIRVEDVHPIDVQGRGRHLRFHHALGSAGANVSFVSPSGGAGYPWLIRTYERGVEGETLACGTGTVAAAIALACSRETHLPVRFRTGGGPELAVRGHVSDSKATGVWLTGQGRLVFRGVWEES